MLLFQQPKFEAILSEVDIVINELHYALANLKSWLQLEYVSKNLVGPALVIKESWLFSKCLGQIYPLCVCVRVYLVRF